MTRRTDVAKPKARSKTPDVSPTLKKASWWVPVNLWEDFRKGCFVLRCSQGEVLRELITEWLAKNRKKIEEGKREL